MKFNRHSSRLVSRSTAVRSVSRALRKSHRLKTARREQRQTVAGDAPGCFIGEMPTAPAESAATREFQAKIVDRNDRVLATGTARLYTAINIGSFWLRFKAAVVTPPVSEATLLTSEGFRYAIHNIRPKPMFHTQGVSHYDFDFRPVVDAAP